MNELPSLRITVTFPFASKTTSATFGFAALILSFAPALSASVRLPKSATVCFSKSRLIFSPLFLAATSFASFTNCSAAIVAVTPSLVVTVAFPFASTTTIAPGFTASTDALILAISSGVKLSLLATNVLAAGVLIPLCASVSVTLSARITSLDAGITATFPSLVVTVAFLCRLLLQLHLD